MPFLNSKFSILFYTSFCFVNVGQRAWTWKWVVNVGQRAWTWVGNAFIYSMKSHRTMSLNISCLFFPDYIVLWKEDEFSLVPWRWSRDYSTSSKSSRYLWFSSSYMSRTSHDATFRRLVCHAHHTMPLFVGQYIYTYIYQDAMSRTSHDATSRTSTTRSSFVQE